MAQLVNVPGVGQLSFPDDMSQPDMAAAIQKNFPQIHQSGDSTATSTATAPIAKTQSGDPMLSLLAAIGGGTQGQQSNAGSVANSAQPSSVASAIPSAQPDNRGILQKVGDFANGQLYGLTGMYAGDTAPDQNGMGGFVTALEHNVVKPFHGLAQLVEHGLGAAADYVDPAANSTIARLTKGGITNITPRSGWNQALHNDIANDDQAMIDWENNYQKSTPDSIASNTGAVAGTILPFLATGVGKGLQFVGDTAASLVPKFLPSIVPKIVSGAVQGGTLALTNPVTGNGNYWDQKANQVENGTLFGGAIPVAGAMLKGGLNVLEPIFNPSGVVSKALKNWIPANAVGDTQELVPGSTPTTAQAYSNNQINAVAKILSENPAYKSQFDDLANSNNSARLAVLQDMAKTPEDLQNAIQARTDATAPWRDQAFAVPSIPVWRQNLATAGNAVQDTIDASPRMSGADFDALQQAKTWINSAQRGGMDSQTLYNNLASLQVTSKAAANTIIKAGGALQNNGNLVDAAPVLQKINDLRASSLGTNPVIKQAASNLAGDIQDGITNTDEGGTLIRPDLLDGYRQNVKDFLAKYSPNGVVSTKQEAAFQPLKDSIVSAIDDANPGYKDYLQTFAQKSVPINDMQAGQSIWESLAGVGRNADVDPTLTLSKITNQINNVKNQPYGISPEAEAALNGVQADLQRASTSGSIRTSGSNTDYNAQARGWLAQALYGDNFKGGWLNKMIGGVIGGTFGGLTGGAVGGTTGATAGATAGTTIGIQTASKLSSFAQQRVNDVLAQALLDPAKAQALLQESQANPILQQFLSRVPSTGAALGLQAMTPRPAQSTVSNIGNATTINGAIQAADQAVNPQSDQIAAERAKIQAMRRLGQ